MSGWYVGNGAMAIGLIVLGLVGYGHLAPAQEPQSKTLKPRGSVKTQKKYYLAKPGQAVTVLVMGKLFQIPEDVTVCMEVLGDNYSSFSCKERPFSEELWMLRNVPVGRYTVSLFIVKAASAAIAEHILATNSFCVMGGEETCGIAGGSTER